MVEGVDRKNKVCQIWVEMFELSNTHESSTFCQNCSVEPEIQRYKKAVFCRNELVHNFGEGKKYPAALHKIPTQTADSAQVLAKCTRQKPPQIIKRIRKRLGKNTIKDLEQV